MKELRVIKQSQSNLYKAVISDYETDRSTEFLLGEDGFDSLCQEVKKSAMRYDAARKLETLVRVAKEVESFIYSKAGIVPSTGRVAVNFNAIYTLLGRLIDEVKEIGEKEE